MSRERASGDIEQKIRVCVCVYVCMYVCGKFPSGLIRKTVRVTGLVFSV